MAVDEEGGGDEPIANDSTNEDGEEDEGRCRIIIPQDVTAMFRQHSHVSERWRGLNAMYFFHQSQNQEKREKEAQSQKEERIRQQEEAKIRHEISFPSVSFISTGSGPDERVADVKGTVLLPPANVPTRVEGYVLYIDPDETDALLVLSPIDHDGDVYFTVLCGVSFLPDDVVAAKKTKGGKDWSCVDFDTLSVRRGSQDLHYVTKGPFANKTCDDAMAELLHSGFIVASCESNKGRKSFGASPQGFDRGSELPSSNAFIIVQDSGVMQLQYSSRSTNDVPIQILAYARSARNNLLEVAPPNGSLNGALKLMENFSSRAKKEWSEYYRCINVALGGSPAFREYGRMIPCAELQRRFPFPNGSFSVTSCSCDIVIVDTTDDVPSTMAAAIRKMKPKEGNNKGHNYVSTKK